MKIDTAVFRQARQQAKLSTRAVAATAGTSGTAVFALEKTGDATHLAVGVLHRIAAAVGLTIPDLLLAAEADAGDQPNTGRSRPDDAPEVMAALLAHPTRLHRDTLASLLDQSPDDTTRSLGELDQAIRSFGLGLAVSQHNVALIGLPRTRLTESRIQAVQKQLGTRRHIDRGDAKIVHAALLGRTTLKSLRMDANGQLRTAKLINAGVLQPAEREIDPVGLTESVRYSLLLDDRLSI